MMKNELYRLEPTVIDYNGFIIIGDKEIIDEIETIGHSDDRFIHWGNYLDMIEMDNTYYSDNDEVYILHVFDEKYIVLSKED